MIYFYRSSRKADKLTHPVTVCASNETQALTLVIKHFVKHHLKGEPKLIAL